MQLLISSLVLSIRAGQGLTLPVMPFCSILSSLLLQTVKLSEIVQQRMQDPKHKMESNVVGKGRRSPGTTQMASRICSERIRVKRTMLVLLSFAMCCSAYAAMATDHVASKAVVEIAHTHIHTRCHRHTYTQISHGFYFGQSDYVVGESSFCKEFGLTVDQMTCSKPGRFVMGPLVLHPE